MSTHRSRTRRHSLGPTSSASSADPQGGRQTTVTLGTSIVGLALVLVLVALRRWSPLPADAERRRLPAALLPGKRIPYGVAIAASAAILALRLPSTFWLF